MRSSRSSFLAAAAVMLAGAGMGTHVIDAGRISHEQSARELRGSTQGASGKLMAQRLPEFRSAFASVFGGPGRSARTGYPRPGWSVRQGQRAACKARNQRRHRRACRKGGRK